MNYFKQLKTLDKRALKLSLICSFNWLLRIILKGQLALISAFSLSIFLSAIFQKNTIVVLEFLIILALSILISNFVYMAKSQSLRMIPPFFFLCVLIIFLYRADNVPLSNEQIEMSLFYWGLSFVATIIINYLQPKIFKHYLFKRVICKEYLGIRKSTDPLPPINNLFEDVKEKDVDKRMILINERVIKPPYQSVVELSFLNREVLTGIHYQVKPFGEEDKRCFTESDEIFYPIFTVHPFGKQKNFYHQLIKFRLSKKAAFTRDLSTYTRINKWRNISDVKK